MTSDEILNAFDNIRVWQRGDRRAPHKPLLILMALGSLARGEKPRAEFAEIEGNLGRLLEEFRKTQRSRPKSRGACSMRTFRKASGRTCSMRWGCLSNPRMPAAATRPRVAAIQRSAKRSCSPANTHHLVERIPFARSTGPLDII